MFDDFESVLATELKRRRRLCGFSRWAQSLEPEHRERAEQLVADRTYNCRALARYFKAKGALFNDQVINRHRNQQCCGQGS